MVDAIDKNNLWENTVVIFSSDHGDGIGAHHWNQKSALYEEVVNILFIVALPGQKHARHKSCRSSSSVTVWTLLRYRLRPEQAPNCRKTLTESGSGKMAGRRQSASSPPEGIDHCRNTIRRPQDTGLEW
ncbi:MAG: sulfatase-like hydrolase/transferase [Bacteroides stercoris]